MHGWETGMLLRHYLQRGVSSEARHLRTLHFGGSISIARARRPRWRDASG